MVHGGLFKGKPYYLGGDETKKYEKSEYWGVISRDAKVSCIKKPKVEFGIEYHRKSFINCVVWGDNPAYQLATTLKRGEQVIVHGEYKTQQFDTKEGRKEYFDLTVFSIIPVERYYALLNFGADLPPDPLESIDDYPEYEGDAPESPLF